MQAYVYILASKPHGTLYIGSCADPALRIEQHRQGHGSQFVKKYSVYTLVYLEGCETTHDAITLERRMKRWRRSWKIDRIEKDNPNWDDLYPHLNQYLPL
ncbi:GIY-YIG nuclease family protein [Woodsholea maritima]|uniref:GIY-YIG nuclease family protein n=1 Tax=Woodsholea maritima TaxID=240237 RepID=UPI000379108C|nr:GIY-YIG nuclease family protein [Woodsholea maritima]